MSENTGLSLSDSFKGYVNNDQFGIVSGQAENDEFVQKQRRGLSQNETNLATKSVGGVSIQGSSVSHSSTSPTSGEADFSLELSGTVSDPNSVVTGYKFAGKWQELKPPLTLQEFQAAIDKSNSGELSKLKGKQFATLELSPAYEDGNLSIQTKNSVLATETLPKPISNPFLNASTTARINILLMNVMALKGEISSKQSEFTQSIMNFAQQNLKFQMQGIELEKEANMSNSQASITAAAFSIAGALVELGGLCKSLTASKEQSSILNASVEQAETKIQPKMNEQASVAQIPPDKAETFEIKSAQENKQNSTQETNEEPVKEDGITLELDKNPLDQSAEATAGEDIKLNSVQQAWEKKANEHGWELREVRNENGEYSSVNKNEFNTEDKSDSNDNIKYDSDEAISISSKPESNKESNSVSSTSAKVNEANVNEIKNQSGEKPLNAPEASTSQVFTVNSAAPKSPVSTSENVTNISLPAPTVDSLAPPSTPATNANGEARRSDADLDRREALIRRDEAIMDRKENLQKLGDMKEKAQAYQQAAHSISTILTQTGRIQESATHMKNESKKADAKITEATAQTAKEMMNMVSQAHQGDRNKVDEEFNAVLSLMQTLSKKDTELNAALLASRGG